MTKRMSPAEFAAAIDGITMAPRPIAMARAVLVDGQKQVDCAKIEGVSRNAVLPCRQPDLGNPFRHPQGIRACDRRSPEPSGFRRQTMARTSPIEDGNHTMKTLVIANQKGGVGKTATLVHLAYYFAEQGLKVAVIDLDTQGNASFTLSEAKTETPASSLFKSVAISDLELTDDIALIAADERLADLEKLSLTDASTAFRASIDAIAGQGFDLCLIDTAPSLGNAMASALLAADYVASPVELEAYSLQGIALMNRTLQSLRQQNPGLKYLGMIPSKVDGRNPRHARHLAELTTAFPALILPTPIGNRSSIADALATKRPVWSIAKTSARKAALEVRAMAQHLSDKMEIA